VVEDGEPMVVHLALPLGVQGGEHGERLIGEGLQALLTRG
jgi:hypothetical protein